MIRIAFLISFAGLALMHNIAINSYLYWQYAWFDILMHFWGGVVVALAVGMLPSFGIRQVSTPPSFAHVCVAILVVGLLWELFEYSIGIWAHEPGFISDTLLDLVMDVIGAILGYGILNLIKK